MDHEIQWIIKHDPYMINSKEEDWEDDMRKDTANQRPRNAFHCALDFNECYLISLCSSAKEIWEQLEATYGGTAQHGCLLEWKEVAVGNLQ